MIARRCFATKSASNEYHFGRPGIPVTLRELEEKMSRDVASLDHFKHMAKVMSERMVASVKGIILSFFQILWKSRCHILVTFPSHLKKLRSKLRF